MIALAVAVGMIAVLAVSTAALVVALQLRLDRDIERIPGLTLRHSAPLATDSEPVNVLVLGTDSRVSAGDPTQWRWARSGPTPGEAGEVRRRDEDRPTPRSVPV